MFKIGNMYKVFSDVEKRIVDLGEDENAAKQKETEHVRSSAVRDILAQGIETAEGTSEPGKSIGKNDKSGSNSTNGIGTNTNAGTIIGIKPDNKPNAGGTTITAGQLQTIANEPKKYKLSPKLAQKIREGFANAIASSSVTVPEFLIRIFGYTVEDLETDDPDVELLKTAWEAQLEVWTEGGELPPWLLITVAQTNLMLKMVLSAKKKKTAEELAAEKEAKDNA